jgi:hypothetical protein
VGNVRRCSVHAIEQVMALQCTIRWRATSNDEHKTQIMESAWGASETHTKKRV